MITDGEPDDKNAVIREIVSATQRMNRDEELSVSFIQIGNDSGARDFLKFLDDGLKSAKFDIVDALTSDEMYGMNFYDLVAKSVMD